jgi:hypothetical protein
MDCGFHALYERIADFASIEERNGKNETGDARHNRPCFGKRISLPSDFMAARSVRPTAKSHR